MKQLLNGIWQATLADGTSGAMNLPGTLDENQLGGTDATPNKWHPDVDLGKAQYALKEGAPIETRFTRKFKYEGEARISNTILIPPYEGERLFVKVERARALRLLVDEVELPAWKMGTITSPYIFELTGVAAGEHRFTFLSDNSYPGMPKDAILFSSAATDETQTNWNGLLGELSLYTKTPIFLSFAGIYPEGAHGVVTELTVKLRISSTLAGTFQLKLTSDALASEIIEEVSVEEGENEIFLHNLAISDNLHYWDEEDGFLYPMTISLGDDVTTLSFGIRTIGDNGAGRLSLNGRTIFLRSEANCGEFPETGYEPMTVEAWREILLRYRSYGINCVRFHSHTPPEAAFTAADALGMMMQPEFCHWNPVDAFESDESYAYYQRELVSTLELLANHPSFVMFTLGNELQAKDLGKERMTELVSMAKELDSTRLFASGSNNFYGWVLHKESDFYAAQSLREHHIRGTFAGMQGYINETYPTAMHNYDKAMAVIREEYAKPVFSFEVGQFEVLPDFKELELFKGISDPANYRVIQEKVRARGLCDVWEDYVQATGELSRLCYQEEIEACMRTKELSGISLLGLQDFPGQGTALVGMMNSHLLPKPYPFAEPEKFKAFFKESMPLVLLPKYTYTMGETLHAEVVMANYGKTEISGIATWKMLDATTGDPLYHGCFKNVTCTLGAHTSLGFIDLPLTFVTKTTAITLTVDFDGCTNTYPLWIYEDCTPVCPETVYEARGLDEKAKQVLEHGGILFLAPDATKEALPASIKTQFSTDFWSVGTFSSQEGGMGQLIDATHPIFETFPTQTHTNWQWWIMASKRAVILPRTMKCIITEMDSYAFLRPMAQLIEFKCGNGTVLLSTMELHNSLQYPEARALLSSIYHYLGSGACKPEQSMRMEELEAIVKC